MKTKDVIVLVQTAIIVGALALMILAGHPYWGLLAVALPAILAAMNLGDHHTLIPVPREPHRRPTRRHH